MTLSRRIVPWFVFVSALSLASVCCAPAFSQEEADVVVSDDGSDAAKFEVPDASSAELITFIEGLANPQGKFADDAELQQYLQNVSTAINAASAKIVADKTATDQQLIDAIEWKMEAMRIRGKLGDATADQEAEAFLAGLNIEGRQAVDNALKEIRAEREQARMQMELIAKLREWQRLDDTQREAVVDWLVGEIKNGEPSAGKVQMLSEFADFLSNSPYSSLAVRAINESLPALRASQDPAVAERLVMLEGLARRLNLPGNELELAGTFLDGTKLDWESYRGKVVLVDFWATWCGPCRAEVPNILANYQKYHDKGFEVIGISLDDRRGDAEQYVIQTKLPWPSLFHDSSDQTGWANPMALKYGITGIPTAILVDQQGKVVSLQARGPRLGAALERLLGGPAADDSSAVEDSNQAERTAQNSSR